MARKAGASTIAANPLKPGPLDGVIPQRAAVSAPPAPVEKRAVTVRLPEGLLERLQSAVYWTPGATVTGIIEAAVDHALEALEKANGGPFKPPAGPIKTGRRAGG